MVREGVDCVRGFLLAPRLALAERVSDRTRARPSLESRPTRAVCSRPLRSRGMASVVAHSYGDRVVHRVERRRPCAPRRGSVSHGRPDPFLWPRRGGRSAGPDADAVPHDRSTRPVGVGHDPGRLGTSDRPLDLRRLGRGEGASATRSTTASRRTHSGVSRPGTRPRLRIETLACRRRRPSLRPPRFAPAGPIPRSFE